MRRREAQGEDAMLDAFKTNGNSPPSSHSRLVRRHPALYSGESTHRRRDVVLGIALVFSPWLAALIVTAIYWPR
jgi:hypothetical protein